MEPQLGDLGDGWELAELWICVRKEPARDPRGRGGQASGSRCTPCPGGHTACTPLEGRPRMEAKRLPSADVKSGGNAGDAPRRSWVTSLALAPVSDKQAKPCLSRLHCKTDSMGLRQCVGEPVGGGWGWWVGVPGHPRACLQLRGQDPVLCSSEVGTGAWALGPWGPLGSQKQEGAQGAPLTSPHARSFPGWNLILSVSRNNFLLPRPREATRLPHHGAEMTRSWGGWLPPGRTSIL